MIDKENFSIEHINQIKENKRVDVNLLERSIYAFGLLEALVKVDMPFIFKGGTCLMLLLNRPRRLSTDIDILVPPGTDVDKDLEVIKQMFDVACLFDAYESFEDISKTYYSTVKTEIEYRGKNILPEDALMDTIESAACVAGRGKYGTEYNKYSAVMKNLTNHIYDGKFSGEIAAVLACKVMYIAACVLKNQAPVKIENPETYLNENISKSKYGKLSYLRKYNAEAFACLVETIKLLGE